MSEQVAYCRLSYHKEIVDLKHRETCLICQQAFTAMSMVIDLSMEEK